MLRMKTSCEIYIAITSYYFILSDFNKLYCIMSKTSYPENVGEQYRKEWLNTTHD